MSFTFCLLCCSTFAILFWMHIMISCIYNYSGRKKQSSCLKECLRFNGKASTRTCYCFFLVGRWSFFCSYSLCKKPWRWTTCPCNLPAYSGDWRATGAPTYIKFSATFCNRKRGLLAFEHVWSEPCFILIALTNHFECFSSFHSIEVYDFGFAVHVGELFSMHE